MNFSTIKKANWMITAVLLATSGILVTSCSKDRNTPIEQTDEHEGTNLVLSIKGINEGSTDIKTQGAVNTKSPKYNVQSYADVDVVSTVDNNLSSIGHSSNTIKSLNGSGSTASAGLRAANVDNGVTYRLYLYTPDGSQLISSQQFAAAGTTNTTIAVTPGTSYKWVALSYNNNDAIPAVTTANPNIELPENKDILYATGTVTVPNTPGADVALPITFNHAFSRLAIELNSMGVFGSMNSGTVSVSGLNLRSGTINVATGAVTPSATTFSPTIDWNSFTSIDSYNDAKITAYVYTAGGTALSDVKVTVKDLAITHADGVDRTFANTTANSNAKIEIPFNITTAAGSSHRLLANVVESPLTVGSGTTAKKFARSNLYYAAGHNPYRFFAENKQRSEAGSYFGYGATIPGKFAGPGTYADPCALVYPTGLWKQPTHNDLAALTSGNSLLDGLLSNIGELHLNLVPDPAPGSTPGKTGAAYNYAEYAITAGGGNAAFGAASNSLRFYYSGQISRVSAVNLPTGLLDLDISAVQALLGGSWGRENSQWASDAPGNILGLIDLGTWGYLASTERLGINVLGAVIAVDGSEHVRAKGTAELLSVVNLAGLNVVSSTLKNVRCVRAN